MNLLGQKITLRRILGMIAGVVVIGIGIAVFKFSRLGNDSISALNLRLAELVDLPFSFGGGGTSGLAPSSTASA